MNSRVIGDELVIGDGSGTLPRDGSGTGSGTSRDRGRYQDEQVVLVSPPPCRDKPAWMRRTRSIT